MIKTVYHLMSLFEDRYGFIIAYYIHFFNLMHFVVSLNSNECLTEGHRSESGVKEEQTGMRVDLQEPGHIEVVRESSGEAYNPNHLLRGLHLSDGASHKGFQYRTSVVMQEMYFIDNEKFDTQSKSNVSYREK